MRRRDFSAYLGGVLLCTALPGIGRASDDHSSPWYASASVDAQGQHWLIAFDRNGVQRMRYALPSRAHQVIKHPIKPWLLVVARRPGQYLLVIDMHTNRLVSKLATRREQHFSGHLQVSADGRLLYTTENSTATSQGLIVVRDLYAQGRIISQFSSGGIGPHQLKLMIDDDILIVANGGIHTRGREKLNLTSMQPNLSYINLSKQSIVEQVSLAPQLAQLSIRHLDVNRSGQVLIAMQYQGERTAQVPLVALHQRGVALSFLQIPDAQYFSLQHYCGSACFDTSGQILAVSAPRGDKILFWQLGTQQYLGQVKVRDGCGITTAQHSGEFLISSGRGRVYRYNPLSKQKQLVLNNPQLQWDNHLALA